MTEHSFLVVTHAFTTDSKFRVEYEVFDTLKDNIHAMVTIFSPEPTLSIESREIVQLYEGKYDADLTLLAINKDLAQRDL